MKMVIPPARDGTKTCHSCLGNKTTEGFQKNGRQADGLSQDCNKGLGSFKDNTWVLSKAIKYLMKGGDAI